MEASLVVPVDGGHLTCFLITPPLDVADGLAIAALSESELAYRVDLDRSILYGYSYGAYVLNRWVTNESMPPSIRWAVCHEGVADLRQLDTASLQIQTGRRGGSPEDCPEHWAEASPIERAEFIEVPMLLVYGADSPSYAQGTAWRDALHAQGIECFWRELPGEGHVFSQAAMGQVAREVSSWWETMRSA